MSEWLSSINQQKTNAGEDVEKGEPFYTVGGNANWCSHCGKSMRYFNKLKVYLPFDPAIPLLRVYPKKPKKLIQKNITPLCSLQHYLQSPRYGSSPSVHQ